MEAKSYKKSVARMLAANATKNSAKKGGSDVYVAVENADGSYRVELTVFIPAAPVQIEEEPVTVQEATPHIEHSIPPMPVEVASKPRAGSKTRYTATLPLCKDPLRHPGEVGAIEPSGRITWFITKACDCSVNLESNTVTVVCAYPVTRARKSVVWEKLAA